MTTLQEAWAQFMNEKKVAIYPTSFAADYVQATKWLNRCPVTDLAEGRQVITWVLNQRPVKASRRVTMYVKSLYRWASSEDVALIPKNPVQNFKLPKPPQEDEEIIVIPKRETQIVLQALNSRKTKYDWHAYADFMLQTAMRTGEVRALKWEDIKEDKILVHTNYTLTHGLKMSTKTNKKRWVPLNTRCQEILSKQNKTEDFIFPYNRYAFQSYFYDRMKELHTKDLIAHRYRPYDLRHTAISRWIEAKIPVAQAAKWAGNSSEVIWKHYVNVTQDYDMPILT